MENSGPILKGAMSTVVEERAVLFVLSNLDFPAFLIEEKSGNGRELCQYVAHSPLF